LRLPESHTDPVSLALMEGIRPYGPAFLDYRHDKTRLLSRLLEHLQAR
ncbi:hypothetical protein SAMN05192548_108014, partial [Paraburkholderia terricola]